MTIFGLHLTFFRFLLIFLALDTFKWSKMDVSTINKVKKWANISLKKEMGTTKKKLRMNIRMRMKFPSFFLNENSKRSINFVLSALIFDNFRAEMARCVDRQGAITISMGYFTQHVITFGCCFCCVCVRCVFSDKVLSAHSSH